MSFTQMVTNGAPKGSVLRPVLFVVFINNLDKIKCILPGLQNRNLGRSVDLQEGRKEGLQRDLDRLN